jgi:Amt family ammonium transporter
MAALAIGVIAGVICFLAVTELKKMFGYDDSLDAFGVHGIGGMTGAILTGIFANSSVNQVFKDASGKALPVGLLEGNPKQLVNQIIGIVISAVLGAVGTIIILKLVDVVIGLRVSAEDEVTGLDLSQHGEEGYNYEADLGSVFAGGGYGE